MADNAVVHIGENSPEQVAYKLLERIIDCERMTAYGKPDGDKQPYDRKWLLKAYSDCVKVVRGYDPPR